MACREIDNRYAAEGYIIKEIKWDDSFKGIDDFPDYEDILSGDLNTIFNKFNISKIARQAIMQQYNEIYIYNEASIKQRELLAPQMKILPSWYNLPRILYPKFYPLIPEDTVWKLNEYDLKVYLGQRLQWYGITFSEYKKFTNQVKDLCEDFCLREDDILLNPSNIGYHPVLGLRIIDYGLLEEDYEDN